MTKTTIALWFSVVAVSLATSPAWAKPVLEGHSAKSTLQTPTRLADNVVVTPQGGGAAPAPGVPAQPVVGAPNQTAVVEAPATNKVVHTRVEEPHNYMTTIALSALMGAVAGGLVGGAIYFLGDRTNAQRIGYWASGGVLLGAGVGIAQILVQENQVSNATSLNKLPSDPAPTFRLALLTTTF
jgi:hypothetical protein